MKKLVLMTLAALAVAGHGFAMDSLSNHTWKHRVLVLFGTDGDPKMREQLEFLNNNRAELADRDMVVIAVENGRTKTIYGSAGDVDAAALTREAQVAGTGFHAVLVGKDGGIKLKTTDVLGEPDLFGLIDRMPMRRNEKS